MTRLPTPAANGTASRSPRVIDQTSTRKKRKGSIALWGFHGSKSSSLPIAQHNAAVAAMAAVPTMAAPRRYANHAIPTMHRALTNATPNATPAPLSETRAGSASRSKYSGPGWFTWVPTFSDADDHVPIRGRCVWVNRSRARIAKSALSSVGIQPVAIARPAADATGTTAATTEARKSHNPRRSLAGGGGASSTARSGAATAGLVSVTSSTLVSDGGPGRTSAHGLAWADEHGRRQFVDALGARPVVLGASLGRGGIGGGPFARAGLRPPHVDVVGPDREVH